MYSFIVGKEGDYAHAYGIVSGKFSKLFDFRILEGFINAKSVEEIIASLEGTEYEKEIKEVIATEINVRRIELALNKHFLRICREIFSVIPDEDKNVLEFLIFEELNVKNIIKILRGLHAQMNLESIKEKFVIQLGTIDYDKLLESIISEEKNVESFISKLYGTRYYTNLYENLHLYKKLNNTLPLENAILKNFIYELNSLSKKNCSKGIQDFIRIKIDVMNIKTILRGKLSKIPYENFLLEGGYYLNEEKLEILLKEEIEEIPKIIEFTPYSKVVNDSIAIYKKEKSLISLEISLDKLFYEIIKEISMVNPLTVYSILSFITAKEEEINNLHTIIICKEYGLTPEEIKKILKF